MAGNGLWSPGVGGQVVSRDCDLLVWVPCSHLIHLSSEWSTYEALKLRDMDFEIPLWHRFWLLPSKSTKSSRKSRLPANDVSTAAHIREHSVAGSARKEPLTTQWRKGPRGGLHERRNVLKLGFWRKKRHLPWGCLERRRQRGGGIQSRRSSVPKSKVQEKQVEWREQQEVPLPGAWHELWGVAGARLWRADCAMWAYIILDWAEANEHISTAVASSSLPFKLAVQVQGREPGFLCRARSPPQVTDPSG